VEALTYIQSLEAQVKLGGSQMASKMRRERGKSWGLNSQPLGYLQGNRLELQNIQMVSPATEWIAC
jgi:hypothetical protein